MARYCVVLAVSLMSGSPGFAQRVIFVNAVADGALNGTSWGNAFAELSDAIESSVAGDRIWVAAGTYRPGSNRSDTFLLKDGVEIYGGFAGSEDPVSFELQNRNLVIRETVLSGAIGGAGEADNSYHVVSANGVGGSAILDGVTVAGGSANGLTLMQQDVGAGMLIVSASPTVRWCLIRDNRAGSKGGAVHVSGGAPLFSHCRFLQNQTTVTQATSNVGGAVYLIGTTAQPASASFVNCLFVGNRAGVGNGGTGGAVYVSDHAVANFVNCTLLHNVADTLTGGIFGPADVTNSILWRNRDRNGLTPTAQLRGLVAAAHSLVQGGWPGNGNINEDPLLANALGDDGIAGTGDDNPRLLTESPCIDAGDDADWPADAFGADLDGAARFFDDPSAPGSGIDMGAFEKQSPCEANSECDDGRWCNGAETCVLAVCRSGTPPDCGDEVQCTIDSCLEDTDACLHEPADERCDNGVLCDGVERCDAIAGCLAGVAPDCDDEIACTVDLCDEVTGTCLHSPDDEVCDDGLFCNGAERCGLNDCETGSLPCASIDDCDELNDRCVVGPTGCSVDADCDDGLPCTDNQCELGACVSTFHLRPCNDGNVCTENDACANGVCSGTAIFGCGNPPPPPPGPGGSNPPPPPEPTPGDYPEEPVEEEPQPPVTEEPPQETPEEEPPGGSPQPCVDDEDCEEPIPPPNPQDSDDDGVEDSLDQCPQTDPNSDVDSDGCLIEDPPSGRGDWQTDAPRRCGACGALGSIGGILMLCVPGTVLIVGRPRGRKNSKVVRTGQAV